MEYDDDGEDEAKETNEKKPDEKAIPEDVKDEKIVEIMDVDIQKSEKTVEDSSKNVENEDKLSDSKCEETKPDPADEKCTTDDPKVKANDEIEVKKDEVKESEKLEVDVSTKTDQSESEEKTEASNEVKTDDKSEKKIHTETIEVEEFYVKFKNL